MFSITSKLVDKRKWREVFKKKKGNSIENTTKKESIEMRKK